MTEAAHSSPEARHEEHLESATRDAPERSPVARDERPLLRLDYEGEQVGRALVAVMVAVFAMPFVVGLLVTGGAVARGVVLFALLVYVAALKSRTEIRPRRLEMYPEVLVAEWDTPRGLRTKHVAWRDVRSVRTAPYEKVVRIGLRPRGVIALPLASNALDPSVGKLSYRATRDDEEIVFPSAPLFENADALAAVITRVVEECLANEEIRARAEKRKAKVAPVKLDAPKEADAVTPASESSKRAAPSRAPEPKPEHRNREGASARSTKRRRGSTRDSDRSGRRRR